MNEEPNFTDLKWKDKIIAVCTMILLIIVTASLALGIPLLLKGGIFGLLNVHFQTWGVFIQFSFALIVFQTILEALSFVFRTLHQVWLFHVPHTVSFFLRHLGLFILYVNFIHVLDEWMNDVDLSFYAELVFSLLNHTCGSCLDQKIMQWGEKIKKEDEERLKKM